MTDLSAISTWLADLAAPPDEACGYVAELLAEVDRLRAECTALLAPVEGVDLEKVLALHAEASATPPNPTRKQENRFQFLLLSLAEKAPILAREVARLRVHRQEAHDRDQRHREEIAEVRRVLGYFAGDGSEEFIPTTPLGNAALDLLVTKTAEATELRARLAEVEQERDSNHAERAEAERLQAVDEATLAGVHVILAAHFSQQLDERQPRPTTEDLALLLVEQVTESCLTLAAEQGRPEGAPSEGWRWLGNERGDWGWTKDAVRVMRYGNGDWGLDISGRHLFAPTARAAMLAADKAQETP